VALEVVTRFDVIFDIERQIRGLDAKTRRDARQRLVRPLVTVLHDWLRSERARMSKHDPVAKAIDCIFDEEGRWDAFTWFIDDGRICLANNAAERAPCGVALGQKAWRFAGSPRGGDRAAFFYCLILTAKITDVDPQSLLADVLARMPGIPVSHLPEIRRWKWNREKLRDRSPDRRLTDRLTRHTLLRGALQRRRTGLASVVATAILATL